MGDRRPAVEDILLPWVSGLKPYSPGMSPKDLRRRYRLQECVKLASNENPLGPSPKAVKAIVDCLPGVNRYPDGGGLELKAALADHLGVAPSNVALGNGSNELIELVARAFLGPGDEAVIPQFSFIVYSLVVQATGATARVVAATRLAHDLEAISQAVGEKTKIIFLANPNNPTGTMFSHRQWASFLTLLPPQVIVVVDEAYAEFVDDAAYPNSIRDHGENRWVLTLRTFSKIYGLAGLRIGYGVGPPELVEALDRVRQPFNVNAIAQAGALAALDDQDHVKRTMENNQQGLGYMNRELKRLGVRVVPSWANFLLFEVPEPRRVYHALLARGVIVRPMEAYGLANYLRVSVGRPEENRLFLEKLEEVLCL